MPTETSPVDQNITSTENVYFRCFAGCSGRHSVYDVIYTCPTCGSLLEVYHEREPLQKKSAQEWKTLLESRASTTQWPYGSGVWNMKEWVIPTIENPKRRQHERRQYEFVLGRTLRETTGRAGSLDQVMRKQPHRIV